MTPRLLASGLLLALSACGGPLGAEPALTAPGEAAVTATEPTPNPRAVVAESDRAAAEAMVAAHATGQLAPVLDLRRRAAFERGHIPGAQRVAPWALAHHPAVRAGRAVVIAAPGAEDQVFEGPAPRGVAVLAGGVAAWCAAGGPIEGRCEGHDLVAPDTALASSRPSSWRVFAATTVAGLDDAAIAATPADAARALAALSAGEILVVVAPPGETASWRAALLRADRPAHARALFADGGREAVEAAAARMAAAARPRRLVSVVSSSEPGASPEVRRKPEGCGCK